MGALIRRETAVTGHRNVRCGCDVHDVLWPFAQSARRVLLATTALLLTACASTRTPDATGAGAAAGKSPEPIATPEVAADRPAAHPSEADRERASAQAPPEPENPPAEPAAEVTPTEAEAPVEAAAAQAQKPKPQRSKSNGCDRPEATDDLVGAGDVQETLEETTCAAALWMDGLFGEGRNLQAARQTSGFVEASTSYSEFKGAEQRLRFRVRFKLPNLQDRFNVVIGRDDEDEIRRDRTERFAVRSQLSGFEQNSSWLAGLGYSLPGTARFSSDFRIGTSGFAHPKLFVQQPTRYVLFTDENDLVYLRGTPFWNTRDGFGLTSGINYDHVLSPKFLLRFTEVGTINENTEGLDWYTGAILYHNLRHERALSYQLLVRGASNADEPLTEYGGRVVFRQPLIRKRLYAEVLTGYTWPREDPDLKRKGSAEVGLSVEMPFGSKDQ